MKSIVLLATWALVLAEGAIITAIGQEQVSPTQVQVRVTSDPVGQPVYLDGQRVDGMTPVTLSLSPGRYVLRVEAEGYDPLDYDLLVTLGENLKVRFLPSPTRPKPPTPAELRVLTGAGPEANPQLAPVDNAEWQKITQQNEACGACHREVSEIIAESTHKTLACSECHGKYDEHVKDGKVIAKMTVARESGIQVLCMACHDQDNPTRSYGFIETIQFPEHLEKRNVRTEHGCEQCHQVHAPMAWVHEAREIVGLPELMVSVPLLNEEVAENTKTRFLAMTETSVVFPLIPGVMGKTVFAGVKEYPADEFLVGGVVLAVGSYFLSQHFHKRKLNNIREINAGREAANLRAQEHNQKIERAMSEYYVALMKWAEDSEGRPEVTAERMQ